MKIAAEGEVFKMKAAVVVEKGNLKVIDLPVPEISDYEALCEMLYGATCSATDLHVIEGCPWNIRYPRILGHESIGRVVEVGKKVRNYKVGDLVTRVGATDYPQLGIFSQGWGGYSEFGVAIDHWAIKKDCADIRYDFDTSVHQVIPSDYDPAECTMFITLRETYSYISRLGFRPGDNILIIGSGSNAFAFAMHSRLKGLGDIVMIGGESRRDKAVLCGVTDYFDYRDENCSAALRKKYPRGFDIIIDAVGNSPALNKVLGTVKYNGTVGIYGLDEFADTNMKPFAAGVPFRFYNEGYIEYESHQKILEYYKEGDLNADAFMDLSNPFPLNEINKAFEMIKNKTLRETKALIKLL